MNNSMCPVCKRYCEDIKHVIFQCEEAKGIWQKIGLIEVVTKACQIDWSGSAVLDYLMAGKFRVPVDASVKFLRETIITAAWYIWWRRRQTVHAETVQSLSQAAMSIQVLVSSFSKAQGKEIQPRSSTWHRAAEGFVSVNVDAKYDINMRSGATGVVIRDDKGNFLAAQCKYIPHVADAMMAEATAMRDGLVFANSLGFPRVEAESDSLNVINFCDGQSRWWDAATTIFAECVDVSSLIGKVVFKHCFRSSNQAAHVLANFSYCNKTSLNWTDEPPGCLISSLVDDVIPMLNQ